MEQSIWVHAENSRANLPLPLHPVLATHSKLSSCRHTYVFLSVAMRRSWVELCGVLTVLQGMNSRCTKLSCTLCALRG